MTPSACPHAEPLESLLEEAHTKLSGFVTDLLGVNSRRILPALAEGETDPAALAALADKHLRATPAQLCDALGACTDLSPVYRRLIKVALQDLQFLEQQMGQLDQELANLLRPHEEAVKRIRHSKSLPKSVLRPALFLLTSNYVPRWGYARETTKAEE